MDDLQNLPEPSRSRAKALLTCRLCSKYLVDPRVLPCRHSFCRKCLQGLYDGLQAAAVPASRRVGSMPCPTCQQPIGVPLTGMRGFPIDTKIARIKDLVVNEMAQNLSKKLNGASDTASTTSDNADDDAKSTRSADDVTTDPRHRRDHSYDNMGGRAPGGGGGRAPGAPAGGVDTGLNYKRNPAYPDFAKFARYFDHDGKPANPSEFRPTIKPDRHRVGYSHSFGHQRRRVTVRMRAYDDTAGLLDDLAQHGAAPHGDDMDGGVPAPDQRGEQGVNGAAFKRSRSARPGMQRRNRSPDRFEEGPEGGARAERPSQPRTTRATSNSTSTGFAKETTKVAFEGKAPKEGGLDAALDESTEMKQRRPVRSAEVRAERPSRTRPSMPTTSLPVHRENILTETSETDRYFGGTERGDADDRPRTSSVRFSSDSSDGAKPATSTRRLPKTPSNSNDDDLGAKSKRSSQARSSGSGGERGGDTREGSSEGNHRSGSGGGAARKSRTTSGDESEAPRVSSSYVTTRRPRAAFADTEPEETDPVFVTPTTRPVFETPKSKQTSETPPRNKPVFDSYSSKPVFDAPSSKPVFETPSSKPVFDTPPRTKPVFETPKSKPVFETPKTKPDFDTTKTKPVFETPRSKPVFETPKSRPDFDATKTKPVFETPKTKPVFDSPKSKPIFETPKRPQASDDVGERSERSSRSAYNTARRPDRPEFTRPSEPAQQSPSRIPRRPRSTPGSGLGPELRVGPDAASGVSEEGGGGRHGSSEHAEEFSTPSAQEQEPARSTKRSSRRAHRSDGPPAPPAPAGAPPDHEHGFVTPVNAPEFGRGDGSRGRTREQMRNDARRSFSSRIRDQFESYRQRQAAAAAESGSDSQVEPGVDPTSPGQPSAQQRSGSAGRRTPTDAAQPRSTSSDRCNAGTPSSSQTRQPEKAASPKQQQAKQPEVIPEPEKPGRNWEDLIRSARNKYSSERVDVPAPVRREPVCADGVYSRWRLAKAEFGIPTSMALTSKGGVVVAEYGQSCLEFYDEGGVMTHSMDGLKPFSVVVNDKDQVIVGDRKSRAVRIFDEFGADVAHWDATAFSWICGLAPLPGDRMVIYDRERCKLGVYSSPGERIREFSAFGSNDSQLCMADFIAVDSKGRVLVADSGNHCIKAFDTNTGTFLAKFGARGVGDGCLDWPKGICVDASDNVIVTDLHNSRVSMFAPTGQFVRHLVTDIENAYSVCYSAAMSAIGLTQYSLDGASQYDVYAIE